MRPPIPTLAARLNAAIAHLLPLDATDGRPVPRAAYQRAMPQYSALDDAFVLDGQTDTDTRNEVRERLEAQDVKPVATVMRGLVEEASETASRDPGAADWMARSFVDAVGRAGSAGGLNPYQAYWLRLTAYCAIVAYAPAGTILPEFPRSPAQEKLPEEERYGRVLLAVVPGDSPSFRVEGGDGDSDLPVSDLTIPA